MKKNTPFPSAENLEQYFSARKIAYSFSNKEVALKQLYAPYKNCMECPLSKQGRSQVVFGEGNPNATIMFVGEGPGRDEDAQGRPFIGRAGQLLNKIIEAMNMKREDVYISNVVKCRPPQNRTPLPNESQTCSSILLFREIEIIKPKVICTLGVTAAQRIISETIRMSNIRGNFHKGNQSLVMPTYHPAYLLRNPEAKKIVWEDMKKILSFFKEQKS